MTCTHATCTTAFCPHCGEGISDAGCELLKQIRFEMDSLTRCLDNEGSSQHDYAKACLVNWTAWESWVAAHIAKDAGGET